MNNNALKVNTIKKETSSLKIKKMITSKLNFKITKPKSQISIFQDVLLNVKKLDFEYLRAKYQVKNEKITNNIYVVISIDNLVKKLKEAKNKIIYKNDQIYIFNNAFWEIVEASTIKKALYKATLKQGIPMYKAKHYSFRDDLYKQFLITTVSPSFSEEVPTRINLLNGTMVFNGLEIEMTGFNKKHFLKYQLSFGFNHLAEAPIFKNYLDKVIPDKEVQMVLAEFIGAIFIKNSSGIKLEKALVLFGSGSNGKSVFFEIIQALFGSRNISNYSLSSLTDNSGYSRAQIGDKLLNFSSEIDKKVNASLFKQLASNEPVDARHPYGRPYQIVDYAKLAFNTNVLPTANENTNAFFRRFIIIPFNVKIREEDQDKELHSKIIKNELPGVFNWILEGLKRVIENRGFTQSDIIDKQVRIYRLKSDTMRLFIIENKYKKSINFNYKLKELYDEYKYFCNDNGYKYLNNREFSDALEFLNFQIKRKNSGKVINIET